VKNMQKGYSMQNLRIRSMRRQEAIFFIKLDLTFPFAQSSVRFKREIPNSFSLGQPTSLVALGRTFIRLK
jgi:hypothetical protein